MQRFYYANVPCDVVIPGSVDEPACKDSDANTRDVIYYLVFAVNAEGNRYMKDLKQWGTKSAKEFFTANPNSHWLNYNETFLKRLELYTIESRPEPPLEKLNESFKTFLKGHKMLDDDFLDLRLFLKPFDSGLIRPFERKEANDCLIKEPYGSWLIRESSIKTKNPAKSDILSCVSISVKNKEKEGKEDDNTISSIIHFIVFHAKGFGYYLPDTNSPTFPILDATGSRYLPLLGEPIAFPEPISGKVFTCFIDLLAHFKTSETRMDFLKYVSDA
jgi:hypothetical protein